MWVHESYLHWDVYALVLGSHMQAGKMWVLQLFLVSGGKVPLNSALAHDTIIAFQGKSALADMPALIYKRWRISIHVEWHLILQPANYVQLRGKTLRSSCCLADSYCMSKKEVIKPIIIPCCTMNLDHCFQVLTHVHSWFTPRGAYSATTLVHLWLPQDRNAGSD